MNFYNKILKKIKLKHIKNKIRYLNKKYFAIVTPEWKELGYSPSAWCYPLESKGKQDKSIVMFLDGVNLTIKHLGEKEIILAFFDENDIELVKNYVTLLGEDQSIVKADN